MCLLSRFSPVLRFDLMPMMTVNVRLGTFYVAILLPGTAVTFLFSNCCSIYPLSDWIKTFCSWNRDLE